MVGRENPRTVCRSLSRLMRLSKAACFKLSLLHIRHMNERFLEFSVQKMKIETMRRDIFSLVIFNYPLMRVIGSHWQACVEFVSIYGAILLISL